MRLARFFKLLPLFLLLTITGCGQDGGGRGRITEAPEDLAIGRMRVAIWPEYDDHGILAIYDGRFEEADIFPIKTSFLIPKGATINDACSLSYEGQHFCQLYKTVNRGAYDEVRLLLPYPNFYLSFHSPPLGVEKGERRIDYRLKANHPIEKLEVDIQQPLRSTGFRIEPTAGEPVVEKGFNHYRYAVEDIARGQERLFKIGYSKDDPSPSVDIKYASMEGPKVWGSPADSQRRIKTIIYALFGTGVLGLLGIGYWFVRSRRAKQGEKPV